MFKKISFITLTSFTLISQAFPTSDLREEDFVSIRPIPGTHNALWTGIYYKASPKRDPKSYMSMSTETTDSGVYTRLKESAKIHDIAFGFAQASREYVTMHSHAYPQSFVSFTDNDYIQGATPEKQRIEYFIKGGCWENHALWKITPSSSQQSSRALIPSNSHYKMQVKSRPNYIVAAYDYSYQALVPSSNASYKSGGIRENDALWKFEPACYQINRSIEGFQFKQSIEEREKIKNDRNKWEKKEIILKNEEFNNDTNTENQYTFEYQKTEVNRSKYRFEESNFFRSFDSSEISINAGASFAGFNIGGSFKKVSQTETESYNDTIFEEAAKETTGSKVSASFSLSPGSSVTASVKENIEVIELPFTAKLKVTVNANRFLKGGGFRENVPLQDVNVINYLLKCNGYQTDGFTFENDALYKNIKGNLILQEEKTIYNTKCYSSS